MPILADALQEAGCEHPDILNRCRAVTVSADEPFGVVHTRGSWILRHLLLEAPREGPK
jgi:hypothetical protein